MRPQSKINDACDGSYLFWGFIGLMTVLALGIIAYAGGMI